MHRPSLSTTFRIVLLAALLAGCSTTPTVTPDPPAVPEVPETPSAPPEPTEAPTAAPTATPQPTATPEPSPTPEPTEEPAAVAWLDPALEPHLADLVRAGLEAIGAETAPTREDATLSVGPGLAEPAATWVYAAVAPFATLADEVSWEAVQAFWAGAPAPLAPLTGGAAPTLLVSAETLAMLDELLGPPSEAAMITVLPAEELVDAAWAARPGAWSVVPFDQLEPRWKVLRIDGLNVLDKALDLTAYPLAVDIGLEGQGSAELADVLAAEGALTNRNAEEMTTLIMTGVTALVRGTAHAMETRGVLFPAQDIGETLAAADLTHISNEVPFYSQCPPADPRQETLVFCSSPAYMDLLRAVGTDLIELTGNHFQDYGDTATLETLDLYNEEGWPYYGGGADLEDASRPLMMEANGNSFSFIGCNPVGPGYAWATEDRPGAAPCNWEYMHGELNRLAEQVDVPIATFQYWEHYFYEATADQIADFRSMADAGAKIVSGSQAHHPQAFEFYNGAFIHYGLGNLFFDQMQSLGTRQEFVDRHVIYQGRHISTELLTYMLEDYARPRPMTAEERTALLSAVFAASGW